MYRFIHQSRKARVLLEITYYRPTRIVVTSASATVHLKSYTFSLSIERTRMRLGIHHVLGREFELG